MRKNNLNEAHLWHTEKCQVHHIWGQRHPGTLYSRHKVFHRLVCDRQFIFIHRRVPVCETRRKTTKIHLWYLWCQNHNFRVISPWLICLKPKIPGRQNIDIYTLSPEFWRILKIQGWATLSLVPQKRDKQGSQWKNK